MEQEDRKRLERCIKVYPPGSLTFDMAWIALKGTCRIASNKTDGKHYCSKNQGHKGPCAAHPVNKFGESSI